MQRASRVVVAIMLSIALLLVVGFCILANLPFARICEYRIDGVSTYSVKRILAKSRFESYFLLDRFSLEKKLKNLAYIENVELSFSSNRLSVNACPKEKGVIVCSTAGYFFFDGEKLLAVDGKDIHALEDIYLLVDVDSEYLMYMSKFGFTSDFHMVLDFLYNLGFPRTLITRIEYGNNKSTERGFLNLCFSSLGSVLIVEDLSKLSYLEECIRIISDEVFQARYDTIFSSRLYGLKSSGLVRIKR